MYTLSRPLESVLAFERKKLKLNLSFDVILRVYELWNDPLFSDSEKVLISADLLIKNYKLIRRYSIQKKNELVNIIFREFIMMGSKATGDDIKLFDFAQDAHYIYSSFIMDYSIDLIEQQGRLHWWKFISMFQGLSENTKIRDIMSIRARPMPAPTKYNAKEIETLRQLKQYYALDLTQEEKERQFERGLEKLARALEKRAVANK